MAFKISSVAPPPRGFGAGSRGSTSLEEIKELLNRLQQADHNSDGWDDEFKRACGLLDAFIKNQNILRRGGR